MRKLIAFVIVAVVVIGAYLGVKSIRITPPGAEGKLTTITRGDLIIPILATGEVQPAARQEVKSEASGEVVEILKQAGERVKVGDLLIRLARDDEERSLSRAQSDLKRFEAALDQAIIAVDDRKARVTTAIADRDRIKAQLAQAEFERDRVRGMITQEVTYPSEVVRTESAYGALEAQLRGAAASVELAQLAVKQAEKDVITAEQAFNNAKLVVEDSEERLAETDVVAKLDGVVSKINVEVGDVIQSGKTTVTGGTVLAVIADLSKIIVQTEVQEAEIGQILKLAPPSARPQMKDPAIDGVLASEASPAAGESETTITVTAQAFPDETFQGVIERVYPEPRKINNVVTYLVDVRVTSENRHQLMLGMQASVDFVVQSLSNVLRIPETAVQTGPDGSLGVYIPGEPIAGDAEQKPKPRFVPCTFGVSNGDFIEITDAGGLQEGQQVYSELPTTMGADDDNE